MDLSNLTQAVEDALGDPKTLKTFATAVAKEILKQKATVSNGEDRLVRKHVIFGQSGSETAKYMTANEIKEEILSLDPEQNIRPRVFGKSLMNDVIDTKRNSQGQLYFVEAVVETITADLIEKYASVPASKVETVVADETTETEAKEDAPKKEKKKDKKGKKSKDKEEPAEEEEEDQAKEEPAKMEVVKDPIDLSAVLEILNDYDSLNDYEEYLRTLKRGKLIKHINKGKMPILTEGNTEGEIVDDIIRLIVENMSPAEEEKKESAEAGVNTPEAIAEVTKKDKKKGKKKDKKKKKKKNKS